MADIDLISATPDPHVSLQGFPVSQNTASGPRGEHEASDVVDQDPKSLVEPEIVQHDCQVEPVLDKTVKDTYGLNEATPGNVVTEPGLASITEASRKANVPSKRTTPASKDKTTVPAKSSPGKVSSSTPTDKKASNSATLGAGSAKAAPPGKTTAASPSSPLSKTAATTPTSGKKPSTTFSANPAKTVTMGSSRGSSSGPAPPSRRSSVLPPRAPSATGAPLPPKSRTSTLLASLASSTMSRPPPAEMNSTSRPSVVSPVGSVASLRSNTVGSASAPAPAAPPSRPRASVSEAVKRTPSSSRQTLPPTTAPPPQARSMRPIGSISSIREVRDDSRLLEDLQEKLKEANANLSVKSDAVVSLETKVSQLEASLGEARIEIRAKTSSIEQLQISKRSSDTDISNLKVRLEQAQVEHSRDLVALNSVSEELKGTHELVAGQAKNIKNFEVQIETLQADVAAAQENFESLRSSSDHSAAEAAAAAQMEREAFLRAKADIETVTAETNVLRAAHSRAIQDAAAKSSESQDRAAEVIRLTAQIGELKAEREESATKISELEVEILELKECQENTGDEHKRNLGRIQRLEAELAAAVTATEQALHDAKARDAENTQRAADTALRYADEVQLIQSDLTEAVTEVKMLRAELAAAHVAHDEAKLAADASAEAREREIEEAEQSYLSKHIELSEEIKQLTAELEAQETVYRVKVDTVIAERDQLVQEAFERARNEAGEVHGQDLQALRAESQATIEQLCAAHQSTINGLQAAHAATLESQVSAVEKKLHNQSLELRATQDDLSKTKAALDTSRTEVESLRVQLEDGRASFMVANTNVDQAAEIERFTKEITNLRDENVMLTDVLAATKESLSKMSANHAKELEEAARIRVEEVMRLRSIHDGELSTLAAQKSELVLSLSDLEGEYATLKAQLAAVEPTVAPRSNGTVYASITTVTRDELQKVHEAHNLRMHDIQAEHDRVVRGLRVEVEALQTRLDEVQQDVARKSMEIQYLEQEQEESQDSITRYVKVFGLQSLFGVVIALAVIFDFI